MTRMQPAGNGKANAYFYGNPMAEIQPLLQQENPPSRMFHFGRL